MNKDPFTKVSRHCTNRQRTDKDCANLEYKPEYA